MQGKRLKTREFLAQVVELLRMQLPAELRDVNVVGPVGALIKVHYGNPKVHYEVWVRRKAGGIEVGLEVWVFRGRRRPQPAVSIGAGGTVRPRGRFTRTRSRTRGVGPLVDQGAPDHPLLGPGRGHADGRLRPPVPNGGAAGARGQGDIRFMSPRLARAAPGTSTRTRRRRPRRSPG